MIDDDKIQIWLKSKGRTGRVPFDYYLRQVNGSVVIGAWDETKLGPRPSVDDLTAIDAVVVPPLADRLIDSELSGGSILRALILAMNDGSFVPGSNRTPAQLRAILKSKMG